MVRSDKTPIGTMETYVNIKDCRLVMFWPITWQEPNHLTERRWAGLKPEMRAAPLGHYSFPMKKRAICLFSCLIFASALLQTSWHRLGRHLACHNMWCALELVVLISGVSRSWETGRQSTFRKCVYWTVLHQCLWTIPLTVMPVFELVMF